VILQFPNLDTLRLALTSGAIPESLRATPTQFAVGADHVLWVQSRETISDKIRKDLRRLGVRFPSDTENPLTDSAQHWLQMFPLAHVAGPIEVGEKTPILFETMRADQLSEIAVEMLRLGNDRQSFGWYDDDARSIGLLRVVGPPYYSLLRSLEQTPDAPIAYREAAPRVWVQLGFDHPLAEHLLPPAGQWLLLQPLREWRYVAEGKLCDIYEVIDFQLPKANSPWHVAEIAQRITVPVSLVRGGAADAAELWVLTEDGIAQLEELVRSSDNELLARLAFAVGEKDGERVVVVRARPSKSAPPVLVLDGIGFRSYLRIPNLFLPIGSTLNPPLRRDAVMRLLTEDKSRITWLAPGDDGTFAPRSLPDDAFRPLSAWVDYVLERDHEAIRAWVGATQFQFESFVCKDDVPSEPVPSKEPTGPKPARKTKPSPEGDAAKESAPKKQRAPRVESADAEIANVPPSELEQRLREVEGEYNAMATPLEEPHRQSLWREMALLNGALHRHADAATCWGNALWEQTNVSSASAFDWYRAEAPNRSSTNVVVRLLKEANPTQAHRRQIAAYLIWAASEPQPPTDLVPHLSKVQRFFEKHEAHLGVRVVWLVWHALYRLSGNDVLLLARARDRVLERLFQHGLTPDLDLPVFLRLTGQSASNPLRLVRDQITLLREQVLTWSRIGTNATPTTEAYIDLVFAYGLARLGEANEARRLLAIAAERLASADEVHSWLYAAFEHRVQQALDGKPSVERLPEHLHAELAAIQNPDYLQHVSDKKQRDDIMSAQRSLCLKIDRMRENSRILEPTEKIDPWRHSNGRFRDALSMTLADLTDIQDRAVLLDQLNRLLKVKQKFEGVAKPQGRILTRAAELAPRLGQTFGEEVLERVAGQLGKMADPDEIADLLEKSLVLAGHLDRKDDVQRLIDRLQQLLQGGAAVEQRRLAALISGSFRALRKFGLRDQVGQLMQQLETMLQSDTTVTTNRSNERSERLMLLLELAGGWFFFGEDTKARHLLDEARTAMLSGKWMASDLAKTTCAYLAALGQVPMEFALARMLEVFRKVEGIYDNYTTVSHYSLTRYIVVEAMMLALVSEDLTLDREARRRLDDDEYLVRRRIHRDVREAMAT